MTTSPIAGPALLLLATFLAGGRLGHGFAGEGSVPSGTPPAPASHRLGDATQRLRRIPVNDARESGVLPDEAKPWLREMKAELNAAVARAFDGLSPGATVAAEVERRVARDVVDGGATFGVEPPDDELGWGYVLAVRAQLPAGHPNLVAVTTEVAIPCGRDGAFSLFRHDGVAWSRVLVEEGREYDDIRGARGNLKYAIGPAAPDGSILVLTTDIPPWCSSVWHPLRYRVRQVVAGEAQPRPLLADETELIAQDEGYDVEATKDGFTLTFSADDEDNPGMRVRERLVLRLVDGKVIERRFRVEPPTKPR